MGVGCELLSNLLQGETYLSELELSLERLVLDRGKKKDLLDVIGSVEEYLEKAVVVVLLVRRRIPSFLLVQKILEIQ